MIQRRLPADIARAFASRSRLFTGLREVFFRALRPRGARAAGGVSVVIYPAIRIPGAQRAGIPLGLLRGHGLSQAQVLGSAVATCKTFSASTLEALRRMQRAGMVRGLEAAKVASSGVLDSKWEVVFLLVHPAPGQSNVFIVFAAPAGTATPYLERPEKESAWR